MIEEEKRSFERHIRDARGRPGEAQFRVTVRS